MMPYSQVFEQSILISANSPVVERCFTDLELMHQWLNPILRCEPIDIWDTNVGGRCRFVIQLPLFQPTLKTVVLERETGLIVWGFEGYFKGCDRWECIPQAAGTTLLNRFEFEIPNPLIKFGFNLFAATLTKADMEAQLRRLKQVAQRL